jgi:hypothetical protein
MRWDEIDDDGYNPEVINKTSYSGDVAFDPIL